MIQRIKLLFITYTFLLVAATSYAEEYSVLGIGAPTMDLLFQVDDGFLNNIHVHKGGCQTLDWDNFSNIISQISTPPQCRTGGSCSNTIKGLSCLGQSVAMFGRIGDDEIGKVYLDNIMNCGVTPKLIHCTTPTQQIAALITPDHQRTFCVYVGADGKFNADDVTPEIFKGVRHVHIEGYELRNVNLVEKAMALAKQAGCTISFDVGNFELVQLYRSEILDLLGNYVDILFANEEETHVLTGQGPEEGSQFLKNLCNIVVILVGKDGCWVASGNFLYHSPAENVDVVDTTGAGDLFASGFLHGYLEGYDLKTCASFGNLTGGTVVGQIGAEIPEEKWEEVRTKMQMKNKDLKDVKDQNDLKDELRQLPH